ncbi:transcriptional regulator, HxlR family [Sanguibacter gelidistatuariae]|uniref:Transcriptional regulator, HxlR family n=1 Tax=Sanguibacter gelidistatuariae TaxID=1814289 RepID=A0A1G6L4S9_9MICO|nr:helix-turn-helix domain-containing protein [Sanguibacter gelidistatuariae]SDC38128.1 transcriptional regulator, HxlR family [Sanguibacter gelidistatuariae]
MPTTTAPPTELDAFDTLVPDVFQRGCDSRRTLETVAGKWGVLSLAALREGSIRFNALRRRVDGVSEKMLAQTLQALERDGLVLRTVRETIPPNVEYSLTPLGTRVADRLLALITVVEESVPEVVEARAAYDTRGLSAS